MPLNKEKVFRLAKGFRGRGNNCIRIARERVEKALQYAYRDRKNKKREMRALWIQRINAGTRQYGVSARSSGRPGRHACLASCPDQSMLRLVAAGLLPSATSACSHPWLRHALRRELAGGHVSPAERLRTNPAPLAFCPHDDDCLQACVRASQNLYSLFAP